MEGYKITKKLGVGAHGAVYMVIQNATKKVFALKKIEVDERKKTRTKEAVLKEASILSQLKHPHIVLFHESFWDPRDECVCIVLDYCDGGTLSERINDASQNGYKFTEKQIMQWFIQIVMAVQYIHSKHILHRDLKTENVFLNKRNVVKVGDFGISKILDNTIDVAKTVVGTPSYLSPELCQDIPYNSKSDIWAVGCLLYEMSALCSPFDGQSLIGLFFNIVKAEYKPLPPDAPEGIKDLVSHILVKTPDDRPSASALLNFQFIKEHLAAFIADTESIRAVRGKREQAAMMRAGGRPDGTCTHWPVRVPAIKTVPIQSQSPTPMQQDRKKARDGGLSPCPNRSRSPQGPCQDGGDVPGCSVLPGSSKGLQPGAAKVDAGGDQDYSDDFDESSDSEIEEDIPEPAEVTDSKSEEEAWYADDFEECDSDDELVLEEVVTQARQAQDLEPDDFYFAEDEGEMELNQTLTQAQIWNSRMKALDEKNEGNSVSRGQTDC